MAVLKLINLKAKKGWTDKSFTELLQVLKTLLPPDNTLPERNYDVKKLLCLMGLDVEKNHACPNNCILYRNEYAHYSRCPTCGESRYKKKDIDDDDNVSEEVNRKGVR